MSETQNSVEAWEEHNESWSYEPPDDPPELWSSEDYEELFDRVINRRVQWTCQKCSKPFDRLKDARRHVEKQHSEQLLERAQS